MFAVVVFGGAETAFADVIYSFTTIDVPGALDTFASGINNRGQIVGGFTDPRTSPFNAYVDTGGSFTTIGVSGTASGINDIGQIVGSLQGGPRGSSGFVDTGGSITTISAPGVPFTFVSGINNSGQIVGTAEGLLGFSSGFVDMGGSFTFISGSTSASGINNSGQIVGSFGLYSGGTFTTISVPGALSTEARGINDSGQIVGTYGDSGTGHGFVDIGGSFTTIDVPGAITTSALGINNSGQIVGFFQDATGNNHGFLATPVATPEPSSLLTSATCLVALFAMACSRKRANAGDHPPA
jgi:probable HAF family extracellular repeat protein